MADEDEIAQLKARLAALEAAKPPAIEGAGRPPGGGGIGCALALAVGVLLVIGVLWSASRQPSLDTREGRNAALRDAYGLPAANRP